MQNKRQYLIRAPIKSYLQRNHFRGFSEKSAPPVVFNDTLNSLSGMYDTFKHKRELK